MYADAKRRRIAIDEARIVARALMSFTAQKMNYVMASQIAGKDVDVVGAWIKVTSKDYGDWYIRIFQDGDNYSGESTGSCTEEVAATVNVPIGATPVTNALK